MHRINIYVYNNTLKICYLFFSKTNSIRIKLKNFKHHIQNTLKLNITIYKLLNTRLSMSLIMETAVYSRIH